MNISIFHTYSFFVKHFPKIFFFLSLNFILTIFLNQNIFFYLLWFFNLWMTFLISTWLINIPNKACSWQFNSSLYFLFFLFKQINATFNLLSILVKQLSANNQACYFCRNSSEIYPQDFHSSVKLFRHIFKPVSSTRAGTVI